MNRSYKKWDIVLVNLDPVKGSEITKTRPCFIVSPNAANTFLNTIIVVPFTSAIKMYPTRLTTNYKGMP